MSSDPVQPRRRHFDRRLVILVSVASILALLLAANRIKSSQDVEATSNRSANPADLGGLLPPGLQSARSTTPVPLTTPDAEGIRTVPNEEPGHEGIKECSRRVDQIPLSDHAAREAEAEKCFQESKLQAKGYVDADPRLEYVDAQSATNWWPFAGAIRASNFPLQQRIYLTANQHRRVDPSTAKVASINIFYENPKAEAATSDYLATINGGGVWLHNQHYAPGEVSNGPEMVTSRPINVRGVVAALTEIRPDGPETPSNGQIKGDSNIRSIVWKQPQQDGGTLVWVVVTDLDKYSQAQTEAFINDLGPLR